ncbi:MAG TPA: glutamate-ammonia-ligase adenylyltransferase, partial [Nitrospiria bacterium]
MPKPPKENSAAKGPPRPLKDLLLAPELPPETAAAMLVPYGFRKPRIADENLQLMANEPRSRQILAAILPELLGCLSDSPDPDQALIFLERFTRAALNKNQMLSHLQESPRTLSLLSTVFGTSPFLAEILIRTPVYLYWLSDPAVLERGPTKREMERELSGMLKPTPSAARRKDLLRIFKRKAMLRIGVRDLLRIAPVVETTEALSDLADVLIGQAFGISEALVRGRLGRRAPPRSASRALTVLGMGKLGGRELNFSSDVDLIYFYRAGKSGRISAGEYFKELCQEMTTALSGVTNEGHVFRVDLNLRPEGKMGSIACPVETAARYYAERGETWERLAMSKARPVAGDAALGRRFLKTISAFVYSKPFDGDLARDVRRMKEKIDRKMAGRGQSRLNVKLGIGGIREIEFIVQTLQVGFGGRITALKARGTLEALERLGGPGILPPEDREHLAEAY